jgi:hypothetical protein
MIECVFTLDYEIYGNGKGSLRELMYEPAERLKAIFRKFGARFVTFAEVAELEKMEEQGVDSAIESVKQQLREFHAEGFELGLHLHPWWYNARYDGGTWFLDHSEYNLCTLPRERISQIIDRSMSYLRLLVTEADFTPLAYRAGHLLFQPTETVANVLAERKIKVDSSLYKGGKWNHHSQDYRGALKNGYYWKFGDEINTPDLDGALVELPIYSEMIPTWKMFTSTRIGLERKGSSRGQSGKKAISRFSDFLRFRYPRKLDFCSMSFEELTRAVDKVLHEDQKYPETFRPIVAIGHTKDLVDFETVKAFLGYLDGKGIPVSTFKEVFPKVEKCLEAGKQKVVAHS